MRAGRIHVGTSGWSYRQWRQHLYEGIPTKRWLAHASRTFNALEINGSFYTQIKPDTYRRWRDETPDGFVFALKGHRFVTHYKQLRNVDTSIALLRDAARHLGDKLVAVVWQLPARMQADNQRLAGFLDSLSAWPDVRHSLEMRHRSWFTSHTEEQLAAAGVAVCLSDAPDFPLWRAITTDLVYVRLHGHTRKYASSYSLPHLRRWVADAARWADGGRDVHVYFDNDAEGAAVHDALRFRAELTALAGDAPRARTLPEARY
jgi:uncharacterized protein YecE (DUF72 family)